MAYYMLAVLAVFFWSFNVIVGTYFIGVLLPWQIAFIRWFIAALVLVPITFKHIIQYKNVLLKHWQLIFWLSLIGIAISNTCVYYASYTVSAIEMSLFSVTGPVFLIIFSWIFLGISLSLKQQLGLVITLFGLVMVIVHGRLENLLEMRFVTGDLWMLAMASTFGLYSFLMSKKPKELPQLTLLSVTVIVGMILTIPYFIIECQANPLTDHNMTPTVIGIMLYMGIFNSFLAYLFWNAALDKMGELKVGSLYYLMPIFSTIEAHLILSERIYLSQVFGGIIIIIGILLTNAKRKKRLRIERA